MNKCIRRSVAALAITAAGLATSATGAFAQAAPTDATVNFQGTVGSVCTFSNVVNGTLVNSSPTILEATPTLGSMGAVDLSCTGATEVSISLPQDNSSSTDILTGANNYGAQAMLGVAGPTTSNTLGGGSTAPILDGGPVNETVNVEMFVDASVPIPAGAYNYNVMVTATPQ